MTRATYNPTGNTLTELPDLDSPPDKPIENNYWGNRAAFYRDMINWQRVMDDYNANALKITAVCRTIPCSPECRGLWKEGQKLEEGKDYEVRPVTHIDGNLDRSQRWTETAFPLPVKSELPLAHIGAGEPMEKQEALCRDAAHILTETNNPNLSKEDGAYWNRWREYFTALWKLIEQGYIITKR